MMKLRELEKVLRGAQQVVVEWRNKDRKISSLTVFMYELKYLEESILNCEVLRVETFEDIILVFIDRKF